MADKVSLLIDVSADTSGLNGAKSAVNDIENSTRKAGEAAKKASSAFSGWAATAMGLNAISDAIGKLGSAVSGVAKKFQGFETSMRAVNTMAGKGEEDFGRLQESVANLGKEIPKTREELANGLYQVISNGVPEDNWISFLEQSAKASVGGIADLGQTVTVTSTLIKNYAASWDDAGAIQDKIQKTAQNGVTSFEQLAAALPSVSGNASALGVSIDELLAGFATLTGVSGNTAAVSTQLGAVFTALVKPSTEASKMAEEMGIVFNASSIKMAGGMQNFLVQLNEAVQSYSKSSGMLEQEVYGRLFGSAEALKALIPLQGNLSESYASNVANMVDATGTIDEAFAQMASTGESANIMLENSSASMTDYVGALASSAEPYATAITNAGSFLTALGSIGTAAKTATSVISTMDIATKASAVSQKIVSAATKAWSLAQAGLNAILTANPIGIVVMAIAALVAGVKLAYDNCEGFREVCDKVFASLKLVGEVIYSVVVSAFKTVVGWIQKAWEWLKEFLGLDGSEVEVKAKLTQEGSVDTGKATAGGSPSSASTSGGSIIMTDQEKAAMAAQKAAEAAAKKKGTMKIKTEVEAPEGSIGALEKQIKDLDAKVKLEVDPAKLAELRDQIRDLEQRKQMLEDMGNHVNTSLETKGFGDFNTKKIEKSLSNVKLQSTQTSQSLKKFGSTAQTSAKSSEVASATIGSMGNLFGSLGGAIGSTAGAMLQWASQSLQAIAQVIPQIAALITAKQAEGMAGATASGSAMPFPANIVAIAAGVAAVVATFASLPKFASGGIAYGPTLGLFGEYSGASNNPEVVAPLDRLKSLIGDAGGSNGGQVQFRIQGRELVGVLARETTARNRR